MHFELVLDNSGHFRDKLILLGHIGTFWGKLEHFGAIWDTLGQVGTLWGKLKHFGAS